MVITMNDFDKERRKIRQKFYAQKQGIVYRNLTRKEIKQVLEKDVFSNIDFKNHVLETSETLNIDVKIVEYVLKHYITNVMILINTTQKIKTKINIYAFFTLILEKGRKL